MATAEMSYTAKIALHGCSMMLRDADRDFLIAQTADGAMPLAVVIARGDSARVLLALMDESQLFPSEHHLAVQVPNDVEKV